MIDISLSRMDKFRSEFGQDQLTQHQTKNIMTENCIALDWFAPRNNPSRPSLTESL